MTAYTHADLTTAIDKRMNTDLDVDDVVDALLSTDTTLMDTLAAILDLHQPDEQRLPAGFYPPGIEPPTCTVCGCSSVVPWPCPTVRVVVDALTRMGAL